MLVTHPKTIGFRVTPEAFTKLQQLVAQTGRPQAELLRLLIEIAEPTHFAPVRLVAPGEPEVELHE